MDNRSYADECERLNQYVDALLAEQSTAGMATLSEEEARIRAVARALKVTARPQAEGIRSDFSAALERRLMAHYEASSVRQPLTAWRKKLRLTTAPRRRIGLVAALASVLILLSLAAAPILDHLRPSRLSFPALAGVAQAYGPLGGLPSPPGVLVDVRLELRTDLPAVPKRIASYRQATDPTTAAEVTDLARRLGIEGSVHRAGESLIADDGHRRLVAYTAQRGYYRYQCLEETSSHDISLDPSGAIQIATSFLEERALLGFEHGLPVVTHTPDDTDSTYWVTFPQTADGITVENAGLSVTLTGTGQVVEIKSRVLRLETAGNLAILSSEEAYARLQSREAHDVLLSEVARGESGSVTQVLTRQVQEPDGMSLYNPGDRVEVEGVLDATEFRGPSEVVSYTLASVSLENGPALRLLGEKVAELAMYSGLCVRVWGLVVVDGSDSPALLIEGFQRSRPQEQLVSLLGRLSAGNANGGGELVLFSPEEGEPYALSFWGQDQRPGGDEYTGEEWLGRKVLVTGVLTGERTGQGLPVLRVRRVESGAAIDRLDGVAKAPTPGPNVIADALPVLTGQGIVEEVRLVLVALVIPFDPAQHSSVDEVARYLLPAYRIRGHLTDGTAFTIYVQGSPTRGGQ